jgi:hypothetical protein
MISTGTTSPGIWTGRPDRYTAPAVIPLKQFSFSKRDTPALGRWKAYFYRQPKYNKVKTAAKPSINQHELIF